MKENEEPYKKSLQQYLDNSISEEDKARLMDGIAANKASIDLEHSIGEVWEASRDAAEIAANERLTNQQHEALFQQVNSKIQAENNFLKDSPESEPFFRRYRLQAAAAVIGVLLLAGWLMNKLETRTTGLAGIVPPAYQQVTNNTSGPSPVILPDQSIVTLSPGATVYFPEQFAASGREVYLSGDAFFEVQKQAGKTFKVLTASLVTEVLGTSFWVREDSATGTSNVEVRTGRVRVAANEILRSGGAFIQPVDVMPNQQVQLANNSDHLNLLLADTLIPIAHHDNRTNIGVTSLIYKNVTRLEQILSEIEQVYGVHIVVANDDLKNCLMSGDLSSQDLFKKLEIICLSVGASYEVDGLNIVISGKGCPR